MPCPDFKHLSDGYRDDGRFLDSDFRGKLQVEKSDNEGKTKNWNKKIKKEGRKEGKGWYVERELKGGDIVVSASIHEKQGKEKEKKKRRHQSGAICKSSCR